MSIGFTIWNVVMYSTMPRAFLGASLMSVMIALWRSLGSISPIGLADEDLVLADRAVARAVEGGGGLLLDDDPRHLGFGLSPCRKTRVR